MMSKSSFVIVKFLLSAVVLACSVEAIQLDCNFEIGGRYSCNATVINSGSSSLESIKGDHEPEKSSGDVRQLYINHQHLPFFPQGIADFFQNLDSLIIANSSLRSINSNDLRPFPGLVRLELDGNQLTSIDGDLLMHTPHLQYVFFDKNEIEHIGHDLVTNLNDLRLLSFQENVCIDKYA